MNPRNGTGAGEDAYGAPGGQGPGALGFFAGDLPANGGPAPGARAAEAAAVPFRAGEVLEDPEPELGDEPVPVLQGEERVRLTIDLVRHAPGEPLQLSGIGCPDLSCDEIVEVLRETFGFQGLGPPLPLGPDEDELNEAPHAAPEAAAEAGEMHAGAAGDDGAIHHGPAFGETVGPASLSLAATALPLASDAAAPAGPPTPTTDYAFGAMASSWPGPRRAAANFSSTPYSHLHGDARLGPDPMAMQLSGSPSRFYLQAESTGTASAHRNFGGPLFGALGPLAAHPGALPADVTDFPGAIFGNSSWAGATAAWQMPPLWPPATAPPPSVATASDPATEHRAARYTHSMAAYPSPEVPIKQELSGDAPSAAVTPQSSATAESTPPAHARRRKSDRSGSRDEALDPPPHRAWLRGVKEEPEDR